MNDRVSPADARKPDSEEPYRYVCPECGRQVQGHERSTNYYCDDCGAFDRDELIDQKRHGSDR
ncbi:hypothetical protein [Haloarcula laminariae]|uniref:hypothetical protein n=1 Tax=Haloarcula laminariae TaxID=2961577 RepID=UPI0021C85368|nr:hypothetical protein [Halomicroarcula laminariae]